MTTSERTGLVAVLLAVQLLGGSVNLAFGGANFVARKKLLAFDASCDRTLSVAYTGRCAELPVGNPTVSPNSPLALVIADLLQQIERIDGNETLGAQVQSFLTYAFEKKGILDGTVVESVGVSTHQNDSGDQSVQEGNNSTDLPFRERMFVLNSNDTILVLVESPMQKKELASANDDGTPLVDSVNWNGVAPTVLYSGFWRAYLGLQGHLLDAVRNYQQDKRKRIILSGYGNGAALAQIAAFDLARSENSTVAAVFAFAAPAVGMHSWKLANRQLGLDLVTARVEAKHDTLSSSLTSGLSFQQVGVRYEVDNGDRCHLAPEVSSLTMGLTRNYSMGDYFTLLRNDCVDECNLLYYWRCQAASGGSTPSQGDYSQDLGNGYNYHDEEWQTYYYMP